MTLESAQKASELLQEIKVAKIQLENFKTLKEDEPVNFINFRIGPNIADNNIELIRSIKDVSIQYLSAKIGTLESELNNLK